MVDHDDGHRRDSSRKGQDSEAGNGVHQDPSQGGIGHEEGDVQQTRGSDHRPRLQRLVDRDQVFPRQKGIYLHLIPSPRFSTLPFRVTKFLSDAILVKNDIRGIFKNEITLEKYYGCHRVKLPFLRLVRRKRIHFRNCDLHSIETRAILRGFSEKRLQLGIYSRHNSFSVGNDGFDVRLGIHCSDRARLSS